jgi:hypothetical protein
MKLPTLQKRFIPEYASQTAGAEMAAAAELMNAASKISKKAQDIRDESAAVDELSQWKLDSLRKKNELAVQYGDDPYRFRSEYNVYLRDSKKSLQENTKVSGFNRAGFNDMLNRNAFAMEEDGERETRKLEIVKTESDFKRSFQNLAELSYEYGKGGDFEGFFKNNSSELSKLRLIGRDVLTPSQMEDSVQKASRDSALSYIMGKAATDMNNAIRELENGFYNNFLPQIDIDDLLGRFKKVREANKDGAYNNEIMLNLDMTYDNLKNFNAEDREKFLINNDNISISYLNDYNKKVEEAKLRGKIPKKEYDKHKKFINEEYYAMARFNISKSGYGNFDKNIFGTKTTLEDAVKLINDNTSAFQQYDRNDLYGRFMRLAGENSIDLNSKDTKQKQIAQSIANSLVAEYYGEDPSDLNAMDRVRKKLTEGRLRERRAIIDNTFYYMKNKKNPRNLILNRGSNE